MIWDALFSRYLKDPKIPHDSWITRAQDESLWRLDVDARLNDAERACLLLTFDWAVIRRENFSRAAADLREFAKWNKKSGSACHLNEWADFIEACDGEAVGFHHTSVSENPWFRWNGDECEFVPLADAKLEVYDELARLKTEKVVPQ